MRLRPKTDVEHRHSSGSKISWLCMRYVNLIRFFYRHLFYMTRQWHSDFGCFRHCGHYSSVCLDELNILVYTQNWLFRLYKRYDELNENIHKIYPYSFLFMLILGYRDRHLPIHNHLFTLIHKSVKCGQWVSCVLQGCLVI